MSLCFVNHQTREIIYADQVGDHVHAEWQQWINERNAVGRVCVGRDLGRRLSFDWLRGRSPRATHAKYKSPPIRVSAGFHTPCYVPMHGRPASCTPYRVSPHEAWRGHALQVSRQRDAPQSPTSG